MSQFAMLNSGAAVFARAARAARAGAIHTRAAAPTATYRGAAAVGLRGGLIRGPIAGPIASPIASPNAGPFAPSGTVRRYTPRRRVVARANLLDEPGGGGALLPASLVQILDQPVLVIERQLEIGSVLLGFEQGRIFRLYRPDGVPLGHLEEVDMNIGKAMLRQVTRLHRPFTVRLFDAAGNHALTIQRPFSFINSHIRAFLPADPAEPENADARLLGESQQEWHLWRRRYNLYTADAARQAMDQFGRVDAPFLSFQFPVQDRGGEVLGAIDRNWTGIGREMFTDTGVYFLRFSPERVAESLLDARAAVSRRPLALTERAVMLATAISVDFDYFSRHSNRGPMFMPFFGDDV